SSTLSAPVKPGLSKRARRFSTLTLATAGRAGEAIAMTIIARPSTRTACTDARGFGRRDMGCDMLPHPRTPGPPLDACLGFRPRVTLTYPGYVDVKWQASSSSAALGRSSTDLVAEVHNRHVEAAEAAVRT